MATTKYTPSQDIIDAKEDYEKAIARYNDWVFKNPNLTTDCILSKKKPTADEIIAGTAKLEGVEPYTSQCSKEVTFIQQNIIPDLKLKYNTFKSLCPTGSTCDKYYKDKQKNKVGYIVLAVVVVIAGVTIYILKRKNII